MSGGVYSRMLRLCLSTACLPLSLQHVDRHMMKSCVR